VAAMELVHRLRLFPTVFEPPASLAAALGDGFGAPCVSVIAAAAQLLAAWQPPVRHFLLRPRHIHHCWPMDIWPCSPACQ